MPGCCVRDSLQSLLHLSISEADQHLPCPCTLWLAKPIRMCADGGEAWDCLPHTNAHTCILSSVSDTGNCLWHMCLFVLFFKQHAKLMGFIIAFSPSQIFSWSSISLHCALILPALPCPVPFHPHGTLCAFIPPILLPSLFLSASPPPIPIPVPTRHVPVASSPAWPGCAPVVFGHLSVVLETLNYNLIEDMVCSFWRYLRPFVCVLGSMFWSLECPRFLRCLDHACFYLYVHKCSCPDFVLISDFFFPPMWSYLLTMFCCVVYLMGFFSHFQNFFIWGFIDVSISSWSFLQVW